MIGQVNDFRQAHGICRLIGNNGVYIYEGQFVNNEMSGYGRYLGMNGNYVGDYKDDMHHGFGTEVNDDKTYVGAWKDSKRHGQGKLTNADGTV